MASWSVGEIEKLRALILRGLPFSKIADILGRTRNACIGRSHRIDDLPKVEKVKKLPPPPPPPKEKKVKPLKKKRERGNIIMFPLPKSQKPKRLTILDLSAGQCRYPIDESRDGIHYFCGQNAVGSYCEKHHKIAYVRSRYQQ
jgi:hypothetical protein